MKKIKLTQQKFVLVDDEDYEWLSKHRWFAKKDKNTYYAVRQITIQSQNIHRNIKNKRKTIWMHRIVMENALGRQLKTNELTDHINKNGLDNRRENLRIVDSTQNTLNRGKQRTYNKNKTSSKYKGVSWRKSHTKWVSYITINYKQISLGYFDNEIEAAKAYDIAALKYFGEFATLNFQLG